MRAVGFFEFGGPEVLQLIDLPETQPGPGQVLDHVAAAVRSRRSAVPASE